MTGTSNTKTSTYNFMEYGKAKKHDTKKENHNNLVTKDMEISTLTDKAFKIAVLTKLSELQGNKK